MNQAGGGNWTHAVSNDLVHWKHIVDALGRSSLNNWDEQGPCDGTASFPVLGGVYDGTVPVIMYGPDCSKPLKPGGSLGVGSGDAPRVEPATPGDPSDPYLRSWIKTPGGPVTFTGTPCSFPGRVWKSKNKLAGKPYWNMICGYDGSADHRHTDGVWARYTSSDPKLMSWQLADASFAKGAPKGAPKADAGALFHKIPGAPAGGPQFMINSNTGSNFYLGSYDSKKETMAIETPLNVLDSGKTFHWAASGNDGPDPETDTGRLLIVAWLATRPSAISLVRSVTYDAKTKQLVSNPVAEYIKLHNATFAKNTAFSSIDGGAKVTLPVPAAAGGALDLFVSFDTSTWQNAHKDFGVTVRSNMSLTFSITAPDAAGTRVASGTMLEIRDTRKEGIKFEMVKVLKGETLDVRMLVDRPIIEVFIQGGRAAAVVQAPFSPTATAVEIFNDGPLPIYGVKNVSAFSMGCGWLGEGAPLPEPIA